MNRKQLLRIMLTLLVIGLSGFILHIQPIKAAEWLPCAPFSSDVDLSFWMENQTSYVSVAITFYDSGWNVSSWGTVAGDGYSLSADSEVYRWTGVVLFFVWTDHHVYNLGQLEAGTYNFTFLAWSHPVKSISFTVGLPYDLNYDGIIDVRDISIVGRAFGSSPEHERWNPIADINQDGIVDIRDISLVARNFGKTA